MRTPLLLLLAVTACGDDGGKPGIDAPKIIDSAIDARIVDADIDAPFLPDAFVPPTVTTVACPAGNTIPEVTTSGLAFLPATLTIATNDIVKFTMNPSHSVEPNTTNSDAGLVVPANTVRCLQFTAAKTLGYHCNPHGFQGTITVQ